MGSSRSNMVHFVWLASFVITSRAFVIPDFHRKFEVDEDGVPIVKFGPRREGVIQNEVFIKPAKVRGVIPVIDNVGVIESDVDYEKESSSSHILPISPEK